MDRICTSAKNDRENFNDLKIRKMNSYFRRYAAWETDEIITLRFAEGRQKIAKSSWLRFSKPDRSDN